MMRIEDVFSPRSSAVNNDIYVHREGLERDLLSGLESHYELLLHGDSGCGKSWLYKKIFADNGIKYQIADCANAVRLGSLQAEFKNLLDRQQVAIKSGYEEELSASLKTLVAEAEIKHLNQFEIGSKEPYEQLLETAYKASGRTRNVLVIDNLESVVEDAKVMAELGSVIKLADNSNYAQYQTKLLIVGVPKGVRDYFSAATDQTTVANRLRELPEVAGFGLDQTIGFCRKGFVELLEFEVGEEDLVKLATRVHKLTLGIPQQLHDLCYYIAKEQRANPENHKAVSDATLRWVQDSLTQFSVNVGKVMNERSTTAGRRNQVLFTLGQIEAESFTMTDVDTLLRELFPKSTADKTLGTSQILADLATRDPALISSDGKGRGYHFSDSRYRMCLRGVLASGADEKVTRRSSPTPG